MWVLLAFVSAFCLGFYDISKKIALRDNSVVDVLTASVLISSGILIVPLLLSWIAPEWMQATPFYVPAMSWRGHLLTVVKSVIVLSSWVCAYFSLKHLPISVVSPWQATRPMWTLLGAMVLFGERLNLWQWVGVTLAIGSIFVFSLKTSGFHTQSRADRRYYVFLALAILIGSCSGLYDKYMMRQFDHNAVQVYYTLYQAVMMTALCAIHHRLHSTRPVFRSSGNSLSLLAIPLISVFLVISDNVYMLALQDPESLIAVVSTIRRGGAIIGFGYGLLFLKEKDPWKKVLCMLGIMAGLICLAMGTH
ncbi:MAG: EamA family transporter [Paludibacteraceae bacterium]|nr:EamA family transporter [Paludibacteraceae bacterium]